MTTRLRRRYLLVPRRPTCRLLSLLFMPLLIACGSSVEAFLVSPPVASVLHTTRLFASTLPVISEMKAGEIRKELESYGVSTKSFLEKKELVAALSKARSDEGKKRKEQKRESERTKSDDANNNSNNETASSSSSSAEKKEKEKESSSSLSRQERLQKELEKAKGMKVGELKKELQSMGISTKTFFEKTEFVKAYAEAVVDGVKSKSRGTSTSGSTASAPRQDEPYDSSYRDVSMRKLDRRELLGGPPIIDVRLAR